MIRPWEEINYTKPKKGLGYDKEVTFHILDYSRLIQFQSVGFLQEVSTSLVPVQHQHSKCQYCNRLGHMEDQCYDLHHCQHSSKKNNLLNKCSKRNKPAILNIHYEWIGPYSGHQQPRNYFSLTEEFNLVQRQILHKTMMKISCTLRGGVQKSSEDGL
jgi:hypothetical protein